MRLRGLLPVLAVCACSSNGDALYGRSQSSGGSGGTSPLIQESGGSRGACTAGQTRACNGKNGCDGVQACADGTAWSACNCGPPGGTGGDTSGDGGHVGSTGGVTSGDGGHVGSTGGQSGSSGGRGGSSTGGRSGSSGGGQGGQNQPDASPATSDAGERDGAACASPAIYVILDQSASMICSSSGGTRWNDASAGITSFIQSSGAASIDVGLGYFGTSPSPPGSSCLPADYKADVEIGPVSLTAQAIVASLAAHSPQTDTPTLPALEGAIAHAAEWKTQHAGRTIAVVLVTDGSPTACTSGFEQVVNAARKGADGGIPTYVIGILSPGSTCGLDPNQPNPSDLDAVAAAGGTNTSLTVDTTSLRPDTATELADALASVRSRIVAACH